MYEFSIVCLKLIYAFQDIQRHQLIHNENREMSLHKV